MSNSTIYTAIAIVALAIIAALVFFVRGRRKEQGMTPLAGVAFACVIAGILFSADRLVGYSLMGLGVLLAVVDMLNKAKA